MGVLFGFEKIIRECGSQRVVLRTVTVGLLMALCFSGRWPGWQIQKNWPESHELATTQYLNRIPNKGALAATPRLLAQLTHVENLRTLIIPSLGRLRTTKENPTQMWHAFWSNGTKNRTNLLNRAAATADHMILDLQEPWQKSIYRNSKRFGWKLISISPDQRYAYFGRK